MRVAYQNVQRSISNTQVLLEWGKIENIDILLVAEGWIGGEEGRMVTTQLFGTVLAKGIPEGEVGEVGSGEVEAAGRGRGGGARSRRRGEIVLLRGEKSS